MIAPRLIVALAIVTSTRVTFGQTQPVEGARLELLSQAEAAAEAGDHTRALDLARRAMRLRPSTSLVAFMAREHRALDQRIEALDHARQCLREVAIDAALRNRDTIREACEAVLASVEPRVARVTVRVTAHAPEGLVVRLGDRVLAPALYGLPAAAMPGPLRVSAESPGFTAFSRDLTLSEGELATVDVALAPIAPPPLASAVTPVDPPVIRPLSTRPTAPRSSIGPGPWIVGALGVASFAAAGVFYGLAMSARDDRDAICPHPERACPSLADDHDARYADWITGTNVALAVGTTAAVGAVAWVIASRLTSRAPSTSAVALPSRLAITF